MPYLLALLLFATPAPAAEISVIGSLVREARLQPGEGVEGVILVRNNDDVPREILVHQADYRFFADGSNLITEPGSQARSNADWIQFSPDQLLVPPRETASVYWSMQAPADPDLDGTWWSLLLVEALPLRVEGEGPEPGRGVQIRTVVRYGIEMISDLSGDSSGDSSSDLSFDLVELKRSQGRTTLELSIANRGEQQLSPRVWIDLFDATGASAGRVQASRVSRLLPGCSARYLLDLSALPPAGYTGLAIADAGEDRVFGADYTLDLR